MEGLVKLNRYGLKPLKPEYVFKSADGDSETNGGAVKSFAAAGR